jgi:hypothetical protein
MGGRGARVAIGEQSEATIGERCSAIFDGPRARTRCGVT